MKKAFTMMELILVIVIVGILAAIMWPRNFSAKAYEAANQIVTHIRYTQHLALNNDKFDPNDGDWYKKSWRIGFNNNAQCGAENGQKNWCYAVYQNSAGTATDAGQPNGEKEAAPNPAEPGKYLTARYSGFKTNYSPKMDLSTTYNVTDISFQLATDSRIMGIVFDDLGRAYPRGEVKEAYSVDKRQFALCDGNCGRIIISAKDGSKANILVFAKTGFACIENNEDCTTELYEKTK